MKKTNLGGGRIQRVAVLDEGNPLCLVKRRELLLDRGVHVKTALSCADLATVAKHGECQRLGGHLQVGVLEYDGGRFSSKSVEIAQIFLPCPGDKDDALQSDTLQVDCSSRRDSPAGGGRSCKAVPIHR